MKLSCAISMLPLILSLYVVKAGSTLSFDLPKIHHQDLVHLAKGVRDGDRDIQSSNILDKLVKDGMVSITGIPSFKTIKRNLMDNLHNCILDQGDKVNQRIYQDGTIRRTLATVTLPGPRPQPIDGLYNVNLPQSCQEFNAGLTAFRQMVDETVQEFAQSIDLELGNSIASPILATRDGSHSFDSIHDIVRGGEHLEHFHSYQKFNNDKNPISAMSALRQRKTIDLHTDQGFFIAFTPGLVISHDLEKKFTMAEDFYVNTSDGKESIVQFDESDDLVFMMGDGVNQYINTKLKDASKKLRAVPHAVSLTPLEDSSQARLWYGRMVLPPKEAYSAVTDTTYGSIRDFLVNTLDHDIPIGVGCSSRNVKATNLANVDMTVARKLSEGEHASETSCGTDELQCWAQCMPLATFGITGNTTNNSCGEQNLRLQCVNPRDQFSAGFEHGDYYPACSNTTVEAGPYPEIPQQDESCATQWSAFSLDTSFSHSFDLTTDVNDGAKFFWSVSTDNKVKAKLVFNNVFGWLSVGLANKASGAKKNGMNGGNVLMAKPGSSYSAVTGLDLTDGPVVHEHLIHSDESSFRHWQDPIRTNPSATVETTECFTVLNFETDNINGIAFNVTGTDELIWAGNGVDHFMGYHLRNRARFTVHWNTGKAYFGALKTDDDSKKDSNNAALIAGLSVGGGLLVLAILVVVYLMTQKKKKKNNTEKSDKDSEDDDESIKNDST